MKDTPCPPAEQARRRHEPLWSQLTQAEMRKLFDLTDDPKIKLLMFIKMAWLRAANWKPVGFFDKELADALGASIKTVRRARAALEAASMLAVTSVGCGGPRSRRTLYWPLLGPMEVEGYAKWQSERKRKAEARQTTKASSATKQNGGRAQLIVMGDHRLRGSMVMGDHSITRGLSEREGFIGAVRMDSTKGVSVPLAGHPASPCGSRRTPCEGYEDGQDVWPCRFPCRRVCEITGETRCGRAAQQLTRRRERWER